MIAPRHALLALLALLGACRGETSLDPPIVPLRNMFDQDRYDTQSASRFFSDGRTMRMPVSGTVPREAVLDPELGNGRLADGSGYVPEIPGSAIATHGGMAKLIERGQERFNIYCRPCHDGAGTGNSRVVERGQLRPVPANLHDERIRHIPDGQLFATISNGVRNMPAYGPQVPIADRWAVVGYVRALQVAQGGP